MARSRKQQRTSKATSTGSTAQVDSPVEPEVATNVVTSNGTSNTNQGERKMAGLTAEQIQQLLGKSRSKGQYIVHLNSFLASGEGGVCANDEWVDLADKKATTLKQGFENAKTNKDATDGAENVKVLVNEDKVYLINLTAAGVAADAEPEAEAA